MNSLVANITRTAPACLLVLSMLDNTSTISCAADPAGASQPTQKRAQGELQALYDFRSLDGAIVKDMSGADQPLDLRISNPNAVRQSAQGLEVVGKTLVLSEKPASRLIEAIKKSGAITIEAWVRPANTNQSGPARIVTLSRNTLERNFTLGHDGDKFDVRLRTTATDSNGIPSLPSKEKTLTAELTHLVYTRERAGRARIYINGKLNIEHMVGGAVLNWDGDYQLALANELTSDRPWLGTYRLLAIYSCDLSPQEVEQNYRAGAGARAVAQSPTPTSGNAELFESRIRPILAENCHKCHGQEKQKGGLRLDSAVALREGATSGPVVVPGKPEESLLIRAVNHQGPKMPPGNKLKSEDIAALAEWVAKGAFWPESDVVRSAHLDIEKARQTYWAFQTVKDRDPPGVKDTSWPLNPIDQFVLAKLEDKGLQPVTVADKRSLIRRATFDLIGLPPAPAAIDAFLADDSPDAFARVVDSLLVSPHYGERWGRHWLDLVRYADTAGDNSDFPIPQMYKYRNWVIRAFNRDQPYDQFLREQIAGDLMHADSEQDKYDKIIATGYLAGTRRFGGYKDDESSYPRYPWHLTIDDTIDNLGRTVLGMTINCARCHDHKFDPLTNEDYYALYGFFQSTRYPWPGIEDDKVPRDFVPLVSPDASAKAQSERQQQRSALDVQIKRLEDDRATASQALETAMKAEGDQREALVAEAKKRIQELDQALQGPRKGRDQLTKKALPIETAYAVAEGTKKVGNAHIYIKGNPERTGDETPRRFPKVLGGMALPPEIKGSGRLELALWLTEPTNPLTARVMVNRVWQFHFGRGIVATSNDFGIRGKPPTHPELLDFLAARFVANGWSLKSMHRLIMLSRTYQLSSRDDATNDKVDFNNEFLWRFNRRRLDAESIRDTMLSLSGALDPSMAGPHPFPDQVTWDFSEHNPFKAVYETKHRSIYLMAQRFQKHPFLALFDGADTNASTAERLTSTTALQALFLMNDPFVHEQAQRFAARLLSEHRDDTGRLNRAYELGLGRPCNPNEQIDVLGYLKQAGTGLQTAGVPADQLTLRTWESFVRALFQTHEFIYVE